MKRFSILLSSVFVLGLGACASQPAAPPLAAAPPPAAKPAPDADATPYGLFLAGRSALHQGRLEDSAGYLNDAATAEGEPPFLKVDAFTASLLAGDVGQAATLAPAAVADDDTGDADDNAAFRLGVVVRGAEALAEGRDKDAYALLGGTDAGYPHKAVAELLAPWAAAGAGDVADAVYRPTFSGDRVAQFAADLGQAELSERVGKLDDAEAQYKALAAGGEGGATLIAAYGAFLERRGLRADAGALYQAALNAEPDNPVFAAGKARVDRHARPPAMLSIRQGAAEALVMPAEELVEQKDEKTALEYLRLALRLDPAQDEAWVMVGDLLADSDDPDGARAAYAEVGPGSDRYLTAREKLAWSYQNGGEADQALKVARDTAAAAPASREAQITLADLLRENDQYPQSAAVLDKLIVQAGDKPDWRLFYLRASAYDEAGDWPRAEADLKTALKLSPDEPELLNFLGYGWVDRGEHLPEGLAMLQRAVEAEPQSGAMIDSLGWAYYRTGDYKDAVDKLEQAVSLEPADPDVNDHLGDAYWRAGRKVEAQFQWRRVLTLDPDDAMKARVEVKLASPMGVDAPPAATTAQ
jgi:Flp pilus assembly protein TadD